MTYTYALLANPEFVVRSDGLCIQQGSTNPHWVEYQAWLSAGNVPTPVATPSVQAQAETLLASTVTITSSGTPALNGQYTITDADQAHINAVVTNILLNGTFPRGTTTYAWPDSSGTLHTFPDVTTFKAFAIAVAGYVAALLQVVTGSSTTLPSSSLTIA